MLERQKILLKLVERAPEGRLSRLKLMKYCFLLAKAWRDPSPSSVYSFVPYKFGPFSFTLYHELDLLVRDGEVSVCDNKKDILRMQGSGPVPLSSGSGQAIDWLMEGFGSKSATRLVDFVYESYPWFTLNCQSAGRRAVSLPHAPCRIYTAGYEGLQVDAFLNRLLENGIRRIIDVRANPISRKYGFHKSTLARFAACLKINYIHLPELGIPSSWRATLVSKDDYTDLFARYCSDILPVQSDGVNKVGELMMEMPSVLICQEADPVFCHRSHLAAHLSHITAMPVRDLGEGNDG